MRPDDLARLECAQASAFRASVYPSHSSRIGRSDDPFELPAKLTSPPAVDERAH